MEQLTREERIARIRKMREERRQAFLEKRWKAPSFLEKFNLQKKEEEVKEEVKEEVVEAETKVQEEITDELIEEVKTNSKIC